MKLLVFIYCILTAISFSVHAQEKFGGSESDTVRPKVPGKIVLTDSEIRTQRAPVWPKFKQNFDSCVKTLEIGNCEPSRYMTYANFSGPSCMKSGRALNLFAINCDGVQYPAIEGGKFKQVMDCLKNLEKKTKTKTIYQNGQPIFNQMAFFSISCTLDGHPRW